mgnify:FL=1
MVIAESDRDLFALCLTIKRKVMKKFLSMTLLLTAMFLTFSACSSDDDETTYTLVFNAYQGISTTLRIFECNDNGEKIGNNSIQLKTGEQQTFTASSSTSKVKIYISRESTMGNTNKWVQQVFLLNKGENTTITIDDKTIVGPNEP